MNSRVSIKIKQARKESQFSQGELACLKAMLNLAEEWDLAGKTVVRKIKLLKEPPGRLRYLTIEEIHRLINAAQAEHLKTFYLIAFSTGLRKGEILGLKWSDIDFSQGIIEVEKTKSGKRRGVFYFIS